MIHNDLALLKPALQNRAVAALAEMREDKMLKEFGVTSIGVLETLRDLSTQMAYYTRGRMPTQDVKAYYRAAGLYAIGDVEAHNYITWTLDSKHLKGEAIDIVPQRNGTPWWLPKDSPVWTRMGEIGEKHGLTWGGRWKNTDSPHFEI